jgi:hypothetical protein
MIHTFIYDLHTGFDRVETGGAAFYIRLQGTTGACSKQLIVIRVLKYSIH